MFKVVYDEKFNVVVNFIFDKNLPKRLETIKDANIFSAKASEVYNDLNTNNEGLIYVGLGSSPNYEELRMAGFNLGRLLNSRKIKNASLNLVHVRKELDLKLILEGLIDSQYKFDYYKVKKVGNNLEVISLTNLKVDKNAVSETLNLMKALFNTRDLVNLAPIDLYPETYVNKIKELFKDTKIEVLVLNKKQIEELGMKALLAVNAGSGKEPYFVILKYFNNNKTTKHLTLVGKGVTYDSGGYAIKPALSMVNMKDDMGGSAAVVGVLEAISANNLKVNVVGIMALTENMIDGNAYKNGDIISSMKGTTIEVVNTDAEGRITLADSIYFAATKLETDKIIEISTLTGAAVTALGSKITGVTTEDEAFYNKIHEAGIKAGEFNWRMPFTDHLRDMVKSDIAELKNSVAGGGGVMTAGIFLNHFAEDKPFLHLDIAGTAFGSRYKYLPEGASGVGVRTIYNYIKDSYDK